MYHRVGTVYEYNIWSQKWARHPSKMLVHDKSSSNSLQHTQGGWSHHTIVYRKPTLLFGGTKANCPIMPSSLVPCPRVHGAGESTKLIVSMRLNERRLLRKRSRVRVAIPLQLTSGQCSIRMPAYMGIMFVTLHVVWSLRVVTRYYSRPVTNRSI
jgi:hypothetical protein